MKYKFPHKEITYQSGYQRLVIVDNHAEVDEKNTVLMTMIAQFGGVKVSAKPKAKVTATKELK